MTEQFFLYISFLKNNMTMTLVKKNLIAKKPHTRTLKTISPGVWNFKNKQKNTPFACLYILKKIIPNKPVHIIFKGESFFRYLILYLLKKENIGLLSISEKTSISYNGCKYSRKKLKIDEY